LIAGRKAKAATAYEVASKCLNVALDLLPESCWQSHYELTLDIYIEALEAEYLNLNFEEAQNLSKSIISEQNLLEKVQVNELKIPFYLQQNQPHLSLELSLQTLQLLAFFFRASLKKLTFYWNLYTLSQSSPNSQYQV
jgi:predicted ATPase